MSPLVRTCARCTRLIPVTDRYCAAHAAERRRARGTTSARGYGHEHQRRRAALLPAAYGSVCALCGEVMLAGQALDLDHSTPRAVDASSVGDRIVHRVCNQRAGGASRWRGL